MKELLESKAMIAFILFILGVVLLNSYTIKQEEKKASAVNTNQVINLDK